MLFLSWFSRFSSSFPVVHMCFLVVLSWFEPSFWKISCSFAWYVALRAEKLLLHSRCPFLLTYDSSFFQTFCCKLYTRQSPDGFLVSLLLDALSLVRCFEHKLIFEKRTSRYGAKTNPKE